jgi:hypothetical protein
MLSPSPAACRNSYRARRSPAMGTVPIRGYSQLMSPPVQWLCTVAEGTCDSLSETHQIGWGQVHAHHTWEHPPACASRRPFCGATWSRALGIREPHGNQER